MTKTIKEKKYDLEERTYRFARDVIILCRKLARDTVNNKLIGQLTASSGSVGANYIEANEALSKKDFLYRIRISRKEAKESSYWLRLMNEVNAGFGSEIERIYNESLELRNIMTAILEKSK